MCLIRVTAEERGISPFVSQNKDIPLITSFLLWTVSVHRYIHAEQCTVSKRHYMMMLYEVGWETFSPAGKKKQIDTCQIKFCWFLFHFLWLVSVLPCLWMWSINSVFVEQLFFVINVYLHISYLVCSTVPIVRFLSLRFLLQTAQPHPPCLAEWMTRPLSVSLTVSLIRPLQQQ